MDGNDAWGNEVVAMSRRALMSLAAVATAIAAACGGSDGGTTTRTVSKVSLTATATTLTGGQSTQVTAIAADASGVAISNPGAITWTSGSSSVATVDQSGKVTAVSAGATAITADIAGVKGSLGITVLAQSTARDTIFTVGIAFSPNTMTISKGSAVVFALGFDGIGHDVRFAATAGAPADIPVVVRQNVLRAFGVAGTFSYICPTHPEMTGVITVQ